MEEMLKLAKGDLESAEILYNSKKYHNALYLYHQCVEKTVKYIGLSTGGISEAQLIRDIKHDPIKVFKILQKKIGENVNGLLPPFDPYLFSSAKQIIDSTSESYIVDEITRNIISICNEEKVINEDQYPSHFDAVCDYIAKVMPNANLSFDSAIIKQCVAVQMRNEVDDVIIFINHGIRMLQILMLNSLVCSKFKPDDFRYASSKLGNPADYFNETSPFILGLPFFIKSMNIPITFAGTINWKKLNIKNNEA